MSKQKAKVEISVVFDNDKLKEAYEKLPEADPLRKRSDYVVTSASGIL